MRSVRTAVFPLPAAADKRRFLFRMRRASSCWGVQLMMTPFFNEEWGMLVRRIKIMKRRANGFLVSLT